MWISYFLYSSHNHHNFIRMLWQCATTEFFQIYLSLVDHIVMKKWRKCDELILVLFMIWKFPPCCSTQWWMKKLSLKQKTDNLNAPNVLKGRKIGQNRQVLLWILSLVAEWLYWRKGLGVGVWETALDVFNGALEALVREERWLRFLVGARLLDVVDAREHSIAPVLQHRQLLAQLLLCHHHRPGHIDLLEEAPKSSLRNSNQVQKVMDSSALHLYNSTWILEST